MSADVNAARQLQSRAVLGVGLMILGLALYALADAFIKHLMCTYSVPQATLLRSVTRFLPLFIATFFQGGPIRILYSQHPSKHAARLAINLAYTLTFMFAISMGSLTTIYTVSYTSPLFMIILGALMLKEKVTRDRWIAVGIGLIGVVIAMRPGSNVFESVAIVVLLGTFLGAVNKIFMRRLAATEHSLAIAMYPNVVMILVMIPVILLFSPWKPMPLAHWGLFGCMGILTASGQYCIAQSLRYAQASTLAPIDYSTFFWVVALDFYWWDKTPTTHALIGAAVIVGSNLYILFQTRREEAAKKAAAAAVSVSPV